MLIYVDDVIVKHIDGVKQVESLNRNIPGLIEIIYVDDEMCYILTDVENDILDYVGVI